MTRDRDAIAEALSSLDRCLTQRDGLVGEVMGICYHDLYTVEGGGWRSPNAT